MDERKRIYKDAMTQINASRRLGHLTTQQYKTLRGQARAGDGEAALVGLGKILSRRK